MGNSIPAADIGLRQGLVLVGQLLGQLVRALRVLARLIGQATPEQPASPSPVPSPGNPTTDTSPPICENGSVVPAPSPTCEPNPGQELFQSKIRQIISPDSSGSISEAQLQYGIISYQLYQKDVAIEQRYQEYFQSAESQGRSTTDAAREALRAVRDEGLIESWEADWLYSLSYRASQLDANGNDLLEQSSMRNFEQAITSAEVGLVYIQDGTIDVERRAL